ncbi:hypothetical protein FHS31_000628 [Sphingomonas vulcanisoli]|uniref:Uncharacterized protein n=1 Tax=Sphingomonas vulcanisoli TaxID=1658060 RepID=A0ABX0TTY6_9SPHN|nr:hypothetical protein [Sphingomonas vulcanisoli]NIJ07046.1 hypothetical protein [Sphingomonas vulcanisoli]
MSETPREKAEAARVRRRWLTLGELLGIAAVVISALTFWNSYRERTTSEAQHQAEQAKGSKLAATLLLKGTPAHDGRVLELAARAEGQSIDSQTIHFPAALGIDPIETSGDPRIERDWFASAVAKARHAAGLKDETGDARLPVLIESRFTADGDSRTALDRYVIGYTTDTSFLSGTRIKLHGLSRTAASKDIRSGQKAIDAAWKTELSSGR